MPDKSIFSLQESLVHFLEATLTQDQDHINQRHWHFAAQLVIGLGRSPLLPRLFASACKRPVPRR